LGRARDFAGKPAQTGLAGAAMILCDTNILIEFFKNNETVTQELHQIGFVELAVQPQSIRDN
jgi:hypothetical protein